jgi:hypothetical protein
MQKKAIKINFSGIEDVKRYYQITDNANGKTKGVLNDLRQVLSLYDDALKLEGSMKKYKADFEKLADEYKKMGVPNVNPNQWQEYRDVLAAIQDLNQTKNIQSSISKAISSF